MLSHRIVLLGRIIYALLNFRRAYTGIINEE